MDILIVAATEMEIAPFLAAYPKVDHLVTGVGIAKTTYHLTRRLHQVDYDLVIQAGIAGTFHETVPVGSLVVAEKDCFAGAGIFEQGKLNSLADAGLWQPEQPFLGEWLVNPSADLSSLPWKKVSAATVDLVTEDPMTNAAVYTKYGADIESMEGAAFHYVCLLEEIPFIQLRAVSNKVGDRNKANWKLKESVALLNEGLEKLYLEKRNVHEAQH